MLGEAQDVLTGELEKELEQAHVDATEPVTANFNVRSAELSPEIREALRLPKISEHEKPKKKGDLSTNLRNNAEARLLYFFMLVFAFVVSCGAAIESFKRAQWVASLAEAADGHFVSSLPW